MTLPRCHCVYQQHTRRKPTVLPIFGTSRESMACMQSDERRCCKNRQDKGDSSTARCRVDTSRRRRTCMSFDRCRCKYQQHNKNSLSALLSSDAFQLDMWCMTFVQMQSCKCRLGNIGKKLNRLRAENDQRGNSCKASVEGRGGQRVNRDDRRQSCGWGSAYPSSGGIRAGCASGFAIT
jgi:hypothetical protein